VFDAESDEIRDLNSRDFKCRICALRTPAM